MKEMNNFSSQKLLLVLTAAGSSTRMGTGSKKEYLKLNGGTVLSEAANVFFKAAHFSEVIVTVPKNGEEEAKQALFANKENISLLQNTKLFFVEGSATRQASVYNALIKLHEDFSNEENAIVLIHDAARPYVTTKIISDIIQATVEHGASVPALQPTDTQKEISSDGTIKRHLVRNELASVQTPQGFLLEPLFKCHTAALNQKKEFTDDTEIWDSYPEYTFEKKVHIVKGDSCNIKITYPSDIPEINKRDIMNNKIIHTGFGTDLHKLVQGRKLILGGVTIPFAKGELGHSDGDVLLHAITDALLGASGLGDIGSYFPSDDPKWKDADSSVLLKKVWADVKNAGWSLCNLDCVVELEQPKFLPYRKTVISSIAKILSAEENQIFVKAKTNEKQDAVGQGNAVKAYCSCLLEKN